MPLTCVRAERIDEQPDSELLLVGPDEGAVVGVIQGTRQIVVGGD